jgi:hypothetical protein
MGIVVGVASIAALIALSLSQDVVGPGAAPTVAIVSPTSPGGPPSPAVTRLPAPSGVAEESSDRASASPGSSATPRPAPRAVTVPDAEMVDPGTQTRPVGPVDVRFMVTRADIEAGVGFSVWGFLRGTDFEESVGFWNPERITTEACLPRRWRHVGPSVRDLADAIVAIPDIDVRGPKPVSVGGRRAVYLDVRVPADACRNFVLWRDKAHPNSVDPPPRWDSALGHTMSPGARVLVWIVDVDGTRVVIQANLVPSATRDFERAVRRIVDSIVLR